MGIDHCGFDILVTEKFLNGADIIACFKQVSCKAMAEGMWADIFMNSCFDGRLANGFFAKHSRACDDVSFFHRLDQVRDCSKEK